MKGFTNIWMVTSSLGGHVDELEAIRYDEQWYM